jgi:uncharacterized protein (DUF2147 family)
MRRALILLTVPLVCVAFAAAGWAADASITGVWSMPILKGKDKGKERLQVEIFEKGGAYYGKIVKLAPGVPADAVCTTCKKDRKNKPLMGMLVLWDLKKEAGRYVDGAVYDVDEGKDYRCTATVASQDKLKITACILSIICESHYWTRVQ